MSKLRLSASAVLAVFLLVVQVSVKASGKSEFESGKKAFQQEKYKKAVVHFERARKSGVRRVALYYNLGVTYYRLGEYEKAKTNFSIVTRDRRLAPVAYYNLGRIARKQKQPDVAKQHFSRVIKISKDQKLTRLARSNLAELRSKRGIWTGAVSAKFGYDDNVTAASGAAQGSSTFMSVSAFTDNLISGTRKKGISVSGDVMLTDYFSQNEDQSSIRLGAKRLTQWGKNPAYYSGYIDNSQYRGSAYQTIMGLEAGGRKNLGKGKSLRARYRYENISSQNPAYDYLQGWRQRIRIEHRSRDRKANKRSRYYYELELNDRQDKTGPAESFSPMRHTFRGYYYWPLSKEWDGVGDFSFRNSAYPELGAQSRTDQRIRFGVTASKKLKKDLKLRIKFRHTNNNSTVASYSYTSNRIYAGVSYYY